MLSPMIEGSLTSASANNGQNNAAAHSSQRKPCHFMLRLL
jgi:hypothetical protein